MSPSLYQDVAAASGCLLFSQNQGQKSLWLRAIRGKALKQEERYLIDSYINGIGGEKDESIVVQTQGLSHSER